MSSDLVKTRIPSLYKRTGRLGEVSYYGKKKVHGKDFEKSFGIVSEARARILLQSWLGELFGQKPFMRGKSVCEDEANKYLALRRGEWRENTYLRMKGLWENHLKPEFGLKFPEEIAPYWPEYVEKKRRLSPKIRLFNHKKFLTSLMGFCLSTGRISSVLKIKNPDSTKSPGKEYTDEEIEKLLSKASDEMKFIIIWALKTGMRANEIMKMEWERVDFKQKFMILREEHTKNKKARNVVFDEPLFSMLLARKKELGGTWVFPQKKDKTRPKAQQSRDVAWDDLRNSAGVKGRFHDLKHTAVTRMIRAGVPLPWISKQVGTSIKELMKTYEHIMHDDIRSLATTVSIPNESKHTLNLKSARGKSGDEHA